MSTGGHNSSAVGSTSSASASSSASAFLASAAPSASGSVRGAVGGGAGMAAAELARLSVVHYETIQKRFGASHVVFWIDVEAKDGSKWTVKHRFSEFVELQKMVMKRFKECDFPSIRSSSQAPEHRRDRLAAFLEYLSGFEEFLKCA